MSSGKTLTIKRRHFFWLLRGMAIALGLSLEGCGTARQNSPSDLKHGRGAMQITSPVFEANGLIPPKYTCDGINLSPPLTWQSVPETAQSLVLICDDPDAPRGTFVHWVLYDLPPDVTDLPEGVPDSPTLENGAVQGTNDFRKTGYGGPCPPGGIHRYYFKLYALDQSLELGPGATKAQVLQAMAGHVLAEGQLMGRYQRQES